MACEAMRGYDKVLFIPAYKPPHRDFDPKMSRHRLEMVKLATACEPKFEASDIEFQSAGERKRPDEVMEPSYTYNTIKKLYEIYPVEGKIGFIIGSDAYAKIDTWYRAAELKELVDFIVFPRTDDISSTALREHIKNNLPVDAIVTKEVECYIREHGLYR
jgi:nicotinate-nucleotide adenylyltransferase